VRVKTKRRKNRAARRAADLALSSANREEKPITSDARQPEIEAQPQRTPPKLPQLGQRGKLLVWLATLWKQLWKFVAAGAALGVGALSVVGVAIQFWPTIAVEASTPDDPLDPYSTDFYIKNENVVPVHEIEASCVANVWETAEIRFIDHPNSVSGFRDAVPSLSRGERYPIRCFQNYALDGERKDYLGGLISSTKIRRTEIQIRATYKIPFFPFTIVENRRRFVANADVRGRFAWHEEPLSQYRYWASTKNDPRMFTLQNLTTKELKGAPLKFLRFIPYPGTSPLRLTAPVEPGPTKSN